MSKFEIRLDMIQGFGYRKFGGCYSERRERLTSAAVTLSSGKPMPCVGLGTASFPLGEGEDRPVVREAVLRAMGAGYRHFDAAAVYGTEAALGKTLK